MEVFYKLSILECQIFNHKTTKELKLFSKWISINEAFVLEGNGKEIKYFLQPAIASSFNYFCYNFNFYSSMQCQEIEVVTGAIAVVSLF